MYSSIQLSLLTDPNMWLRMRNPHWYWSILRKKGFNRTDIVIMIWKQQKNLRKQNCIIWNRFDFNVISKIWSQQEIKQRLHLYIGIVQNRKLRLKPGFLTRCHISGFIFWSAPCTNCTQKWPIKKFKQGVNGSIVFERQWSSTFRFYIFPTVACMRTSKQTFNV